MGAGRLRVGRVLRADARLRPSAGLAHPLSAPPARSRSPSPSRSAGARSPAWACLFYVVVFAAYFFSRRRRRLLPGLRGGRGADRARPRAGDPVGGWPAVSRPRPSSCSARDRGRQALHVESARQAERWPPSRARCAGRDRRRQRRAASASTRGDEAARLVSGTAPDPAPRPAEATSSAPGPRPARVRVGELTVAPRATSPARSAPGGAARVERDPGHPPRPRWATAPASSRRSGSAGRTWGFLAVVSARPGALAAEQARRLNEFAESARHLGRQHRGPGGARRPGGDRRRSPASATTAPSTSAWAPISPAPGATAAPVSVAIIDVDHFKQVNDSRRPQGRR